MWPVILYNRGGTGDFSLVDDLVCVEFYPLAKEGYIVLATEYRSTGGKGRRDEWGGADVHDVLNLATVAKALGYNDMERMFMLGVSRGGTMTYLALNLKTKVSLKAAAVIAGPSDLESLTPIRSRFFKWRRRLRRVGKGIQLVHHIRYTVSQVILRQPVTKAWG